MNTFELIAYPLMPVAALELLLGFLLLRQQPRNSPVNKSVAAIAFFSSAFALNTAVMYLLASRGHDYNLSARMNWIGWFAIPAAIQFSYFLQDEQSRKARVVGCVLYPYWAALLALTLFTDLIVTPAYTLIPYSNRPGPLEAPARLSGAAMIVWLVFELLRARSRLSGIKKIHLNYFLYGALIYAFAAGLIAGVLPALGIAGIEPGLGSYFSLPWVVLTFYAIVRYSLFEARIIVSRTLNVILLVLLFSGIQIGLHRALLPAFGTEASIVVSLSLLGFFLFGTPLSKKLQVMINSLVIGDRYGYQSLLRESVHALISREKVSDLPARFVEAVRKALGVDHAGLYLQKADEGYVVRFGCGDFEAMTGTRALAPIAVQQLRETKRSLIRSELEAVAGNGAAATLMSYLRGIGAAVIVPLFYQGRLEGALALGEKGSGEHYGQSDIDLLETIASQTAVAIENARLLALDERVRASLQEREGKFLALAQTIPAAIFIHQGERIMYANAAARELTGYSQEQLLARNFWDLIQPEYRTAAQEAMVARKNATRHLSQQEFRLITRNGGEPWVVMTADVIEYGGKPALIWALFDITVQKRVEGEQRYRQRMDSLGRLAMGLASDFNSILRGIMRAGTALLERLEPGSPLRDQADQVFTSAERASWLTRSLVEFGSREETQHSAQELNTVIRRAERFLPGLLSRDITLRIAPSPERLVVNMDTNKIERVLMNLAVNARDAMPEGGTVTIETGTAEIDAAFIQKHGCGKAGAYAFFSLSDTGVGMDETLRKRIFEPFFTTKTALKATGFGLSIAYDIVKEHGGYITVASAPGRGSVFVVYLPLVSRERERTRPA